jgi:hypothetical protein
VLSTALMVVLICSMLFLSLTIVAALFVCWRHNFARRYPSPTPTEKVCTALLFSTCEHPASTRLLLTDVAICESVATLKRVLVQEFLAHQGGSVSDSGVMKVTHVTNTTVGLASTSSCLPPPAMLHKVRPRPCNAVHFGMHTGSCSMLHVCMCVVAALGVGCLPARQYGI